MVGLPSSLSAAGCRKPKCHTGSDTLHRHHKRHQAMWLGIWASERQGEPEFREFVERYHAFVEDDVVIICNDHHAEIHLIYDKIIRAHKDRTGKPLYKYTWAEANDLMDQLEEACIIWLAQETPGASSDLLRQDRRQNRETRRRKGRRSR